MSVPFTASRWIVLCAALAGSVACTPESPGDERAASTKDATAADPGEGAQITLEIREWPVPWKDTRPRDPAVGPDGSIWFVGQVGDYLARLDPESGEMKRFDLPPGTGPHTVIVDRDGVPWVAGNRAAYVGKLDPASGEVTRYDMPDGVEDPHTLAWTSKGEIWFTAQRSPPAGYVGRFSPETGETSVVVEIPVDVARPYGIVVDAADRPWIAFMGTNAIGTVDPETNRLRIVKTPDPASRIRRIGITSDGRIWWTDAARGFLGVYDPRDETMKQWRSPGGEASGLYAMAVDHRDRIWFVETGGSPNRFVGFDPATEAFVANQPVPSGGGAVRHMVFDRETSSIWFGTDTHTIGRARVR